VITAPKPVGGMTPIKGMQASFPQYENPGGELGFLTKRPRIKGIGWA
jgi:hypothetical protein